eukprot:GHUV01022809.1.p1 GENE.GHUV01022809.1~~GHUV01022809.1.p1  ORF type:complete len:115 (-),score=12.03 GHUV01022809.1:156-500(-)
MQTATAMLVYRYLLQMYASKFYYTAACVVPVCLDYQTARRCGSSFGLSVSDTVQHTAWCTICSCPNTAAAAESNATLHRCVACQADARDPQSTLDAWCLQLMFSIQCTANRWET